MWGPTNREKNDNNSVNTLNNNDENNGNKNSNGSKRSNVISKIMNLNFFFYHGAVRVKNKGQSCCEVWSTDCILHISF